MIRMHIKSIMVGGGPIPSGIVLVPARGDEAQESGEEAPEVFTGAAAAEALGASEAAGERGSEAPLSELPIRIGTLDAVNIGTGIDGAGHKRPLAHDLMATVITMLGGKLERVCISHVEGNTFFATLDVTDATGAEHHIDARPSDAIALAVRTGVGIYAAQDVITRAGTPDFDAIAADEQEREAQEFHDFLENLNPEDFNEPSD